MELTDVQAQRVVDDIAADDAILALASRLRAAADRLESAPVDDMFPTAAAMTYEMLSARISHLEHVVRLLYGDPDVPMPAGRIPVMS